VLLIIENALQTRNGLNTLWYLHIIQYYVTIKNDTVDSYLMPQKESQWYVIKEEPGYIV